jgi:hypothetical protein
MSKFLRNLIVVFILVIVALVVGMISPGQWLTEQSWKMRQLYYQFQFKDAPIADNFAPKPFGLRVILLKNTGTGKLETYLVNPQTNTLLPVYEIANTIQVGDLEYRLRGVQEEAQKALEKGGKSALDKLRQIQDLFK